MSKKNNSGFLHPSGDKLINVLSQLDGLLGEYVGDYPGEENDPSDEWLDVWFGQRIEWFLANSDSETTMVKYSKDELIKHFSITVDTVVRKPCRVQTIQPNYFRGFRKLEHPIDLSGDLIVIDGPNSSGKTSYTEAFEWLFTGELLRRSLKELGNPRELENCICNQLRPEDEKTWVEATFISEDEDLIALKRVLTEDYGYTQTSLPKSVLFKNGKELGEHDEVVLINELFAGEPPLLMQHSLRLFINSTPSERRIYFEQLLQLNELTHLIGKSVIGNARLPDFIGPAGGVAYKKWSNFKIAVKEDTSKNVIQRAERNFTPEYEETLKSALIAIAQREFSNVVKEDMEFIQIRESLLNAQQAKRQQRFPILEELRPRKLIDDQLLSTFSPKGVESKSSLASHSLNTLKDAREASDAIDDAQLAVASAFRILSQKGLIEDSEYEQICPLCSYEPINSLTPKRIREIKEWQPVQSALDKAIRDFDNCVGGLKEKVQGIFNDRKSLIPGLPDEKIWEEALNDTDEKVREKAKEIQSLVAEIGDFLHKFDKACVDVENLSDGTKFSDKEKEAMENCTTFIENNLGKILDKAKLYAFSFEELEETVDSIVSEDPAYDLRQQWLDLEYDLENVVLEIRWEKAKKKAQRELENIREILKSAREIYLENRREDFSDGIGSIWDKLRNDRYSTFNKLRIPPPRGRGFPVEIEVKAILDDGNQQVEVDALRVFSESQVNVLGISAFITRAKLIGHKTLIIDDPVQSMDEDHFLTFAEQLLPHLLDEGFQVIVLTHNDKFARDVSHKFFESEEYVTMSIQHSRRHGCMIKEGNRRVAERLKVAENKAEDGDFEGAWIAIRKSIERLYLVIYIKYGPSSFNPHSWQDQTSDYMWGNDDDPRVGQIIEKKIPGIGHRLKQILDLSVAGAHDKSPRGFTDITNAIKDIKSLLNPLRVGG